MVYNFILSSLDLLKDWFESINLGTWFKSDSNFNYMHFVTAFLGGCVVFNALNWGWSKGGKS